MKPWGGLFRAAVLALLLVTLLGVGDMGPARPAAARALVVPAPVDIAAGTVDLHDGMVARFGSTYYLYGTEYGCGYTWRQANTPWCGFGVSTAPSMSGPWSAPTLLFSPNDTDPWSGLTWVQECGATGQGCFNPRMIQRSGWGANDGVFVLWFNSVVDYSRNGSNAYNTLGCNGPAGPCGPSAGAPYGSYHKPALWADGSCNGDFGFVQPPNGAPAMVCSHAGETGIAIEQINSWGTDGTEGTGGQNIGGMTAVEGPGGFYDAASGTYVLTYSDPDCGYCAGAGAGYATASGLLGPYTAPVNVAALAAPVGGRRDLSATSCGGQPRTVSVVDGTAWQGIDLWTGSGNETRAGLHFEPLVYDPAVYGAGAAGDGGLWRAPFAPWTCT